MSKVLDGVKVGDKLLVTSYGTERIEVVDRTTATRVTCGAIQFMRNGTRFGEGNWVRCSARPAVPADVFRIADRAERHKLCCDIDQFESHVRNKVVSTDVAHAVVDYIRSLVDAPVKQERG